MRINKYDAYPEIFSADISIDENISSKVHAMSKGSAPAAFVILSAALLYYLHKLNGNVMSAVYVPPFDAKKQNDKPFKLQLSFDSSLTVRSLIIKTKGALSEITNRKSFNGEDTQNTNINEPVIALCMESVHNDINIQSIAADAALSFSTGINKMTCHFKKHLISNNDEAVCIFAKDYIRILEAIISNPNATLSDINIEISTSLFSDKQQNNCTEVLSAQKRIYLISQQNENMTMYNMPIIKYIEGKLDYEKFNQCINTIVERHDALRMSFDFAYGKIVQNVKDNEEIRIEHINAEGLPQKRIEEIVQDCIKPFDLKCAPLFRVFTIRIGKDRHILLLDVHHIICDGFSADLILDELTSLYDGKKLSDPGMQYRDYIKWHNNSLKGKTLSKQGKFWRDEFKDGGVPLNIPTDYVRPVRHSFEGDCLYIDISKNTWQHIILTASKASATVYMVILAALNILLHKYTGQEDITVGCPVSGRQNKFNENIVGMFVNTIAIRNKLSPKQTLNELLTNIKKKCLSAYENQDYEFEMLIDSLELKSDAGRNPIFDIVLTVDDFGSGSEKTRDFVLKDYNLNSRTSKFDLSFHISEIESGANLLIEYSTKLFKRSTVERMAKHYLCILDMLINKPGMAVCDLCIMDDDELQQMHNKSQGVKIDYPKEKTIHRLFEDMAEKIPNQTAVKCNAEKLTYKELNDRANAIAQLLRSKGIGKQSIVGIIIDHCPAMFIGILGILKAGAAYLPINPKYPQDRIRYIIEDSCAKVILSRTNFIAENESFFHELGVSPIDLNSNKLYIQLPQNPENINEPHDIAYIIYTSGSTGKPKGVMVEHRSLNNYVHAVQHNFGGKIGIDDNTLIHTNISFDVNVFEIFSSLIFGATVVPFPYAGDSNLNILTDFIVDEKITFAYIPPVYLKELFPLLNKNKDKLKLNKLFLGVEPIQDYVFEDYLSLSQNMTTINYYGPTEATVCSTFYLYKPSVPTGRIVPIGRPLPNTRVYILDKNLNMVPKNVIGEIYVSGDNLARGYLNNHELTDKSFICNPFVRGERMYKTGDTGKWSEDYNVDFCGRNDTQVKIRGIRIEMGEIENVITSFGNISEAVVVAKDNGAKDKHLCAYFTSPETINIPQLREYLTAKLPQYMVPTYFIQMDKIPSTVNGKINRKELPEADYTNTGLVFDKPTNSTEKLLSEIWGKILNIDMVGINNSFIELGGHSIKAMHLSAEIYRCFKVNLPIGKIFELATVKNMAEYLSHMCAESNISVYDFAEITPVKEGCYAASSAEKRMYILQQFSPQDTGYNISVTFSVLGRLDRSKFEDAVNHVIKRHDILRTTYELINGQLVQHIHEEFRYSIDFVKCSEDSVNKYINELVRPFDLSVLPLMRISLINVDDDYNILAFNIHHIISDAASMEIMLKEIISMYYNRALPEVRLQYKNFAAYQNQLMSTGLLANQEKYWLNVFETPVPYLNLKFGHERPKNKSYSGDSVSCECNEHLTKGLKRAAVDNDASFYIILFAAYNLMLSLFSKENDIVIGCPISGRHSAGTEDMIGLFVNTLPIRNRISPDMTLKELIASVRNNVFAAYDNQDYPVDLLIDKLNVVREPSRNPLFDFLFNMASVEFMHVLNQDELYFDSFSVDIDKSLFDLTLEVEDAGNSAFFTFIFNPILFDRNDIKAAADKYLGILYSFINDINQTVESVIHSEKL